MFDLLDYRRRTGDLYHSIQDSTDPYAAWQMFGRTRDLLLKIHPQSPLNAEARAAFFQLA